MRECFVYILANESRLTYIGVTSNLLARVNQHKKKEGSGFTSRYNITKLVFFEATTDIRIAIAREKQLKG